MSLKKVLAATIKHSVDVPDRNELRVSSLPYCPILDYLKPDNATMKQDFAFSFYTEIGTALHNVFQKVWPNLNVKNVEIFGNWKCPHKWQSKDKQGNLVITHCGKRAEWTTKPDKIDRCERSDCPCELVYDELELAAKIDDIVLSGHIDMILKIKVKNKNKTKYIYHLIDFKTTGNGLFDKPYMAKYYPSKKYLVQVRAYSTLLWKLHKIRISKYSILYVAREKPINDKGQPNVKEFTYSFTKDEYSEFKHAIDRSIKGRKISLSLKAEKQPTKAQLLELIATKPCYDHTDYLNYMEAGFFGKNQCPFYTDGSCFRPKKLMKLLTKKV